MSNLNLSLKYHYIHLLYGNDIESKSRRVLGNKRVSFDVGVLILKLTTLSRVTCETRR